MNMEVLSRVHLLIWFDDDNDVDDYDYDDNDYDGVDNDDEGIDDDDDDDDDEDDDDDDDIDDDNMLHQFCKLYTFVLKWPMHIHYS